MGPPSRNLTLIVLRCLIGGGIILIVLGATPVLPAALQERGVQAAGLALLLLGSGEYLNHLPGRRQRPHRTAGSVSSSPRAPCALGNALDVLGIVAAFAAITLLFLR